MAVKRGVLSSDGAINIGGLSSAPTSRSDLMPPDPVLIASILCLLVWLLVVAVVIAACRMAARSDAPLAQSPRRPSTWGTVRNRILTSPHSDQFATYK